MQTSMDTGEQVREDDANVVKSLSRMERYAINDDVLKGLWKVGLEGLKNIPATRQKKRRRMLRRRKQFEAAVQHYVKRKQNDAKSMQEMNGHTNENTFAWEAEYIALGGRYTP